MQVVILKLKITMPKYARLLKVLAAETMNKRQVRRAPNEADKSRRGHAIVIRELEIIQTRHIRNTLVGDMRCQ